MARSVKPAIGKTHVSEPFMTDDQADRCRQVTVKGVAWRGPETYWPAMICSPPPVEDVTARSIRVSAGDYRAWQPHFAYWAGGFSINGRFIRLLDSEILGTCGLGGYRAECINNTTLTLSKISRASLS